MIYKLLKWARVIQTLIIYEKLMLLLFLSFLLFMLAILYLMI